MATRTAEAEWHGRLASGDGNMKLGSGAFEGRYSFGTRFGEEKGTNPEELIAAAHAGCFSMALAYGLEQAGFTAKSVRTKARVQIEKSGAGFAIPKIELSRSGVIPGRSTQWPRCRGSMQHGSNKRPRPLSAIARYRERSLDLKSR
jgi:osmotically inducible protein OsmC